MNAGQSEDNSSFNQPPNDFQRGCVFWAYPTLPSPYYEAATA
ncbi:MAG: hypothetical protein AB9879_03535 [Methanothrix sp.]